MTDITVIRGAGERQGDDVQDPLITSATVAVARGTMEIDAATPASIIDLRMRYRDDLSIGDLVEISDPDQGSVYRAQIIAIGIDVNGPADLSMSVRLWRPL